MSFLIDLFIVSRAEKNLQVEPQLEGKRQEMLYKVRCGCWTRTDTQPIFLLVTVFVVITV